jgi:pyrrolysine biosynthesis protein PylC
MFLIDKNPRAGASLMCDSFLPLTITCEIAPCEMLKDVDLILPAMENDMVLAILEKWSLETAIPLAFDMEPYAISSSKKRSDQIFKDFNINAPKSWPECGYHIVVKSDGQSGSRGVKIIHNEKELASSFPMKESLS